MRNLNDTAQQYLWVSGGLEVAARGIAIEEVESSVEGDVPARIPWHRREGSKRLSGDSLELQDQSRRS